MTIAQRTLVTFESDKFNTTEQKESFVNPDCFGDDVCAFLIERLRAQGVQCDAEPIAEDFGWCASFHLGKKNNYWFIVGYRAAEGTNPAVWIGVVERNAGLLGEMFGKKQVESEAVEQVHKALSSELAIRNIRWHRKSDFDAGREELGQNA